MAPKRPYSGSNYPSTKRVNVPMVQTSYTGRRPRRYNNNRYSNSRGGTYRALTNFNRHINPVYPRPEVKSYDSNQVGALPTSGITMSPIPDTGLVFCINQLNISVANQGYAGSQYSIVSCGYRFEVSLQDTQGLLPTSGRVVLIWDKQPNGAVAAWTDIFSQAVYTSFGNWQNRQRFVILRNCQFNLSPNGEECAFYEGYAKINMTTTSYTSSQGAAAPPPLTGALLLAYISDQADSNITPVISGTWRIRYYDN
nr:capsid protein [Blackfly multicomponent virus 1]